MKIIYFSNISKVLFNDIEIPCENLQDFIIAIRNFLKEKNCKTYLDNEHIFISIDNTYRAISENDFPLCTDAEILYSIIVAPNNAYEYCRENGIVYFFHTNEGQHKAYPHIHAKYSGEEISIYIRSGIVEGKFSNKTKQKEALQFTQSHKGELLKEWEKIMQ